MLFVSATVPGQGVKSLGSFLDARFPGLDWIRTAGAHRPIQRLANEFELVEDGLRGARLVELCEARAGRCLVFANSASRAEDARRLLSSAGVAAKPFHPGVAPEKRDAALAAFGKQARGVLVCSGLAARGLDLPAVDLVIEYQMAPNLVEYMHRVGRTARAGREGRAVSLVSASSKHEAEIVQQVQRCVKGGWKYL